ncbi:GNAT family N-acetyltransferase [Paucilactobacillus nenjiangensis]|uniref:GNAT family N-acetyltransferase n=2 Tax=Paucilactobacillus nenjiangensis TaxID=1296540 RepID=A0A5P1WYU6_9LACO|nr:GNAT family N-acetyltransferase [Paucilactobacillus nenjiangensis]QER66830.1 GNAT family N-acetyltransferase [Paucilactobacillus nenjiangensis]
MDFKIKPIRHNQLNELQAISIETFTATFGQQNTADNLQHYLDDAYNLKTLSNELRNPDSYFYFLYVDEAIAGYLKLNVNHAQSENMGGEALEVERIYLTSNYQKFGLGKKLIYFAEQQAKQLHKKLIWLGVWEHNNNAQHFYEHLGFVPFSSHSFWMGTNRQTDILMQKSLKG